MKELEEYVVSLRRRLHEIPELSWQEDKTLALLTSEIEEILDLLPWETRFKKLNGGIFVDVEVNKDLPWRLFRADVDALPIEEETYSTYTSKHKGRMHACGHDAHSSMLLGALKSLPEISPACNMRFLWQRAEEVFDSGAKRLIEEGILDGVDEVYGLHVDARKPLNVFCSRPGLLLCQATKIEIEVEANGGHVMSPKLGTNAIDSLMDLNLYLNDFVNSSYADDLIAFSPSMIHAGTAENIRPNTGKICFALRSLLPTKALEAFLEDLEQEAYLRSRIKDFTVITGPPALVNNEECYLRTKTALEPLAIVEEIQPQFAGEDFAYYLQKVPGCFWTVGARVGEGTDHHSSIFQFDEAVLMTGVKYWHQLALMLACRPVEVLF